MKNLQINESPIGAQEYPLAEKSGMDTYIYNKDPNIYLGQISIYKDNHSINNDLWFDSNEVEADQFYITDYWTVGNYSTSYRNGFATYDHDKLSKWDILDTHTLRVRAYSAAPPFDNYYDLLDIQLGYDNQFHVVKIHEGIKSLTWEDGTSIDTSNISFKYVQFTSSVDYLVTSLRIYFNS